MVHQDMKGRCRTKPVRAREQINQPLSKECAHTNPPMRRNAKALMSVDQDLSMCVSYLCKILHSLESHFLYHGVTGKLRRNRTTSFQNFDLEVARSVSASSVQGGTTVYFSYYVCMYIYIVDLCVWPLVCLDEPALWVAICHMYPCIPK
jgi:hypothetical protein